MRTVQMTLEDELVWEVDAVARQLRTTRSAFTRQALREALARHNTELLERKHRQGYERHPVAHREFSVWKDEHVGVEE